MKQYIGTKIVEAEPANKYGVGGESYIIEESREITSAEVSIIQKADTCVPGYRVRYSDGYESWSPKDVFEKYYLPITTNEKLKTDAPSVSKQMVDDFIAAVETTTVGFKTTIVRVTLRNGFEIVESSSCVSVSNYDEKLGESICLGKIKDKIWMLLGFLLQTGTTGVKL